VGRGKLAPEDIKSLVTNLLRSLEIRPRASARLVMLKCNTKKSLAPLSALRSVRAVFRGLRMDGLPFTSSVPGVEKLSAKDAGW